ncbi:hypothetical protein HHK36_015171 [Tetracentron sinense]|uniref:Uncharacterized protein n=1 Tax=Tetracentron sinense TaxID=13715 RepID=A0A834Z8R1_TETSI|nr:hypothetical protein HHK36_015171 [Tetracentron sinense]
MIKRPLFSHAPQRIVSILYLIDICPQYYVLYHIIPSTRYFNLKVKIHNGQSQADQSPLVLQQQQPPWPWPMDASNGWELFPVHCNKIVIVTMNEVHVSSPYLTENVSGGIPDAMTSNDYGSGSDSVCRNECVLQSVWFLTGEYGKPGLRRAWFKYGIKDMIWFLTGEDGQPGLRWTWFMYGIKDMIIKDRSFKNYLPVAIPASCNSSQHLPIFSVLSVMATSSDHTFDQTKQSHHASSPATVAVFFSKSDLFIFTIELMQSQLATTAAPHLQLEVNL